MTANRVTPEPQWRSITDGISYKLAHTPYADLLYPSRKAERKLGRRIICSHWSLDHTLDLADESATMTYSPVCTAKRPNKTIYGLLKIGTEEGYN